MSISRKINENLYLVEETRLTPVAAPLVRSKVNHVAVIDCSGSMWTDLPNIRTQLKQKLPKLLAEGDTMSIVWFSGKTQFGTLLEAEPVSTLADLAEVEKAIDRWLRPVGWTGFKEPLEEVSKLVERVSQKNTNPFALFFMSDGHDNVWSHEQILKAAEAAGKVVMSSTFVEYGYYADRALLSKMAERCGGSLIFAADFNQYAPVFESRVQQEVALSKVKYKVAGDPICGFAYSLSGGEIATYAVENGEVEVPENVQALFYLSPVQVGSVKPVEERLAEVYAAISLFSIRGKSTVVWDLLRVTGDVAFIDKYGSCFGKQKYTEFMEETKAAAFDETKRLTEGYNRNRVAPVDSFTVLDLFELLQSDPETRLLLDSDGFKYSRIGRTRVDANTVITKAEQKELDSLYAKLPTLTDTYEIATAASRIKELASKPDPLKFVQDENTEGYELNGLVLAEDRPNISVRVLKHGYVDLSRRLPDEFRGDYVGKIPEKFRTFVFRNYTLVKDGLINVEWLPMRTSKETYDKIRRSMKSYWVVGTHDGFTVNLSSLPIINRRMVRDVSAVELFSKQYELLKEQAKLKVLKAYKKELEPEGAGVVFTALYGEAGANWLKENGITENSGFNPRSALAPATDFYKAKTLVASIKGLANLPSLKDVKDRVKSGKMTPSAELMAPTVAEMEKLLAASVASPDTVINRINGEIETCTQSTRKKILELAKTKFAVVVGQTWPVEFSSMDETELTFTADGKTLKGKLEMKEKEVSI